jgi:hypothetical protein
LKSGLLEVDQIVRPTTSCGCGIMNQGGAEHIEVDIDSVGVCGFGVPGLGGNPGAMQRVVAAWAGRQES